MLKLGYFLYSLWNESLEHQMKWKSDKTVWSDKKDKTVWSDKKEKSDKTILSDNKEKSDKTVWSEIWQQRKIWQTVWSNK
jgi:hypothetical protein